MTEDQESYADKIAKLLAKAESPACSPEEAEVFLQGAQQLQTKYMIDEEMIARARGGVVKKIIEERIVMTGVYAQTHFDMGQAIAEANDCKVLYGKYSDGVHLVVIGFEDDVAKVKMFCSSVMIQATGGVTKWAADGGLKEWMSGQQRFKARREYLFGFAEGLRHQLLSAIAKGRKEAEEAEAARSKVSEKEASASVELVLRDKRERVQDWMDEKYGRLRNVSRNYSRGGADARAAGHTAGMSADVTGHGRVRGNLGQLGR